MKPKTFNLVLKKQQYTWGLYWLLYDDVGNLLDNFEDEDVQSLFNPGDETCLILEVKAHPATWKGAD